MIKTTRKINIKNTKNAKINQNNAKKLNFNAFFNIF